MHLLLCTTRPQLGLVHTGHMDQGALASTLRQSGVGVKRPNHLTLPITQLKFVQAHKDGLADHVCCTQICPSLKIIPNTSGRNATAQQSCQQHSCAVAAKPGSST